MNESSNEPKPSAIFCPSCAAAIAEQAEPGTLLRCPVCGTEFTYQPEKTAENSVTEADARATGSQNRRLSTDEILLERLEHEPPAKKPIPGRALALLLAAILIITFGIYKITSRPDTYAPGHEVDTSALLQKRMFFQHIVDSLQTEMAKDPYNIDLHLALADANYDAGLWADSKKEFQIYLAAKPKDADARVDYSYAIAQDGDLSAAITEIDTALIYQPDHLNALINAGIMTAQTVSDSNHATALARSKAYFERAKEVAQKTNPDIARRIDTLIMEIDSTGLRMRQQ